jgi:para-aminobenzoate synthetase component 1
MNSFGSSYDLLVAAGETGHFEGGGSRSFEGLKEFCANKDRWAFGFLSYDLKNELEDLKSENYDGIGMPDIHFFNPEFLFLINGNEIILKAEGDTQLVERIKDEIDSIEYTSLQNDKIQSVSPRISREDYLKCVKEIKDHIKYGNVYELNFCQEFYADNFNLNPFHLFQRLNDISETPFSSYYRLNDKYLICGSPERFMKKTGDRIISQPIKGTIKRGETEAEDLVLKQELAQSAKDMNENVMIVDIVRNDLSRTAARNSVHVSELFGIYTFKHVHQMISTVESELADDCHFIDAIREAFPMGSMTGAPKIKAMELIEQFEHTKRGLYSGAAGYITPSGDFDFNVVIRSLLYNSTSEYLSFIVGGAITDNSIAEDEYEECLLKAIPMFKALNLNLKDVNLVAQ